MAKQDVYEIVVSDIVAKVESGEPLPWRKPWAGSATFPRNAATNRAYNGINTLILWMQNHADPRYATYKQAQAHGGQVRKGSKGIRVVFWNVVEKADKDTGETRFVPFLRYYTVFNVADIDGAVWPHAEPTLDGPTVREDDDAVARAHAVTAPMPNKPAVTYGSKRGAYYSPKDDAISLPAIADFHSAEGYAETYLHELVHSTGHSTRLDRHDGEYHAFGTENYGREELVAEIGAAFLLAHAGITCDDTRNNTAAYVRGWLKAIKDDPKAIVYAAARAQKAADYILDKRPEC